MELHVDRERASAQLLKRAPVDYYRGNMDLVNYADGPLVHCDVSRAIGAAPNIPIAGASKESTFKEKSQVAPLFLGDSIALHAICVLWMYSRLIPARRKNLRELGMRFAIHGLTSPGSTHVLG